jgi:hypothetical protein
MDFKTLVRKTQPNLTDYQNSLPNHLKNNLPVLLKMQQHSLHFFRIVALLLFHYRQKHVKLPFIYQTD